MLTCQINFIVFRTFYSTKILVIFLNISASGVVATRYSPKIELRVRFPASAYFYFFLISPNNWVFPQLLCMNQNLSEINARGIGEKYQKWLLFSSYRSFVGELWFFLAYYDNFYLYNMWNGNIIAQEIKFWIIKILFEFLFQTFLQQNR